MSKVSLSDNRGTTDPNTAAAVFKGVGNRSSVCIFIIIPEQFLPDKSCHDIMYGTCANVLIGRILLPQFYFML